jgi:hypothetical protein
MGWAGEVALTGKVKGKVVPVRFSLTKHHAMKAYWASGAIAPCIFDLGTGWK